MQYTVGEARMHSGNVLLWTLTQRCANIGQPARTYLPQLCADTGCSLEDLLRVIDNRDGWGERIREIHTVSMT